jgi:hypothetical protein
MGGLARPSQSEYIFPHKRALLQTEIQLSRWLVSDDPAGEEAGCGGPGLAWLHVVWRGYTVMTPVGCTAKFYKIMLEAAYGREMNI